MDKLEVVCLCEVFDLKQWLGPAFAREAPWLRLLRPEEVSDPASIRHAFAFAPGPEAFAPYPNLALVSSAGAGVDGVLANPSLPADAAVSRVVLEEQGQ
ncbi:MAG: hydroxyacid dehydrogenase, partial [Alphaproteobacteria bacterium]